MGLYTNNLSGYRFNSTAFESLEEDASLNISEGTSLVEAAMNSIAITEENWNAIQREVALTELRFAEETGQDFVYTEATSTGFIAKSKEFFHNIWVKIQELFKKFLVILGQFNKDDKEFVKKYSKTIVTAMKNIPSDATFKGYTYTLEKYNDMLSGKADNIKGVATSAIGATDYATIGTNTDYDYGDIMDTLRGNLLAKSAMTASEFSEEIFKMLRNGEDSKDDIDMNSGLVNSAIGELQGMKAIKKVAKDAYDNLNKAFTKLDKDLDNTSKEIIKTFPNVDNTKAQRNSNALTGVNRILNVSKGAAGALQTANGIFLTACKEASRQYKAICVKAVTYRNVKESSGFLENAGTDMFAGVVLR